MRSSTGASFAPSGPDGPERGPLLFWMIFTGLSATKRPRCASGSTPKARSPTCSGGRNRSWRRSATFRATAAENEIAAGHPQGGRAADFGNGEGLIVDAVREYITPKILLQTTGGDSSTGEFKAGQPGPADGVAFTPLLPPRMPPKDEQ